MSNVEGDEWKQGTPYENPDEWKGVAEEAELPEDTVRTLSESFLHLAKTLGSFSKNVQGFYETMLQVAIRHLLIALQTQAGLTHVKAREELEICLMVAAAEGTAPGKALHALAKKWGVG